MSVRSNRVNNYQLNMMECILLVLCIGLAFYAPGFATLENFLNILRSVSMLGIIAFGMTFIIISGEIDLSVGSMAAFSGCLLAYLTAAGCPIFIGIPLTLIVGLCIGFFTGFMRVKYLVPSFITTLALFTALKGFSLMITNGFPISPFPEWFGQLGGGYFLGIPIPAIIFLIVFGISSFVMNYTTFGRSVYAVGGNAEAARLSGINVPLVRMVVLGATGFLAALSGILLSAQIMSGTPTVAQGWELDIIAAVIIGGTSLMGGKGSIRGTLIGMCFIGVIINGMTLLNVQIYTQYVMRGFLILAAVLINGLNSERKK